MNDLEKVFLSELQGIYDAEQQILKALPKMEEKAQSADLKAAFREHLEQTKGQVKRLERVFQGLGQSADRKTCKGMAGIIDDGELMAAEFQNNTGLDAALICAAQQVEHFEIATCGSLCAWADELDYEDALPFLKENLSEEKETDDQLTNLAMLSRNLEAVGHDTEKRSEFASKIGKMVGV